jgi:hypothetical protein
VNLESRLIGGCLAFLAKLGVWLQLEVQQRLRSDVGQLLRQRFAYKSLRQRTAAQISNEVEYKRLS